MEPFTCRSQLQFSTGCCLLGTSRRRCGIQSSFQQTKTLQSQRWRCSESLKITQLFFFFFKHSLFYLQSFSCPTLLRRERLIFQHDWEPVHITLGSLTNNLQARSWSDLKGSRKESTFSLWVTEYKRLIMSFVFVGDRTHHHNTTNTINLDSTTI